MGPDHPDWDGLTAALRSTEVSSAERREVASALADASEEMGDGWFADAWRAEAGKPGYARTEP